jgi:hypothetical protein
LSSGLWCHVNWRLNGVPARKATTWKITATKLSKCFLFVIFIFSNTKYTDMKIRILWSWKHWVYKFCWICRSCDARIGKKLFSEWRFSPYRYLCIYVMEVWMNECAHR